MREIKFRAWDKKEKIMIDLKFPIIGWASAYYKQFLIPMQYTGLKDKNSKEIYEGDITYQKARTEYEATHIVEWSKGSAGFYLKLIEGENFAEFMTMSWGMAEDGLEVIGNIYENPELLEEARK